MQFEKNASQSWVYQDTPIENLFINEYMCDAPGDYVKVYLLAQMYACVGTEVREGDFAMQLQLDEEDIEEAFRYWEKAGLLVRRAGGSVVLHSIREKLTGGTASTSESSQEVQHLPEAEGHKLTDGEIAALFTAVEGVLGRPLGTRELQEIDRWTEEEGATPELVLYAYKYCVEQQGKDSVRYVAAVVRNWIQLGLDTDEKIADYIKNNDARHAKIRRVLSVLGLHRNVTEPEKKIFDRWFDEDGFTMEDILAACEKTTAANNPSIKYLDSILKGMHEAGKAGKPLEDDHPVSVAKIDEYYRHLQEKERLEAKELREKAYAEIAGLEELDKEADIIARDAVSKTVAGDFAGAKALREKREELKKKRAALLEKAGHGADYTDIKYLCGICKDTGFTEEGARCSCYEQRAKEAKEWQISLRK
ncbi:MAG: DnaD domain protein [Firmicutes bacterium]|nr:DnaD domain protein [Bacillota bacterium]